MNAPTQDWQRGASSALPPPSRSWLYRVAGVMLATLLVGTAAAWVLLWLAPPGPAVLVVGAAGYEEDLAVPANPQGRETARRLLALAGSSSPLSSLFGKSGKLRAAPLVEMKRNADWARGLDSAPERTAIVYLGMHGGADSQGAFLFPNDASADPEDRLRLAGVLDRLEKLPADRSKLLLLDATANGPDLTSGLLMNGFARALEALDARIAAIPNLVVMSASGPDERSWPSANVRTTLFGKHLVDGLAGQAAKDSRLDARALFAYLTDRVGTEAHRLYGTRQTPMLLPKSDGLARASRISLTFNVEPVDDPEPADPLPNIQAAWREYHAMGSRLRAAEAVAPRALRLWRAWLLRHEQLALAGAPTGAALAHARAAQELVQAATGLVLATSGSSFAAPALAGETELDTPAPFPQLDQLWAAPPSKRALVWATVRSSVPRRLVQQGLVQRAASNPARNLAHAAELLRLADDPLRQVRPIEAHLAIMAARDLAPSALEGDGSGMVGQALRLRMEAERAAFAVHSGGYANAERVWEWIRPTIEIADAAREKGQDLLFATSATDAARAAEFFAQAETGYKLALADGAAVRGALAAVARAWNEVPAQIPWLAASRPDMHAEAGKILEETRRLEELTTAAPKVREPGKLQEMRTKSASVQAGLARLRDRLDLFGRTCEGNNPKATGDAWRALSSPELAPAIRWRLVQRLSRLARRERSTVEAGAMPTAADLEATTKARAGRLGRVALSALAPSQPLAEARHRLEAFPVEERWRLSLAQAGDAIGKAFRDNASRVKQDWRVAYRLDAGQWQERRDDPAARARMDNLARLLVWQAERTWRGRWANDQADAPPYYRLAGLDCLADAARVAGKPPAGAAEMDRRLRQADSLAIKTDEPRHLLAGERQKLTASVSASDGLEGYPVLWAEPGPGLVLPRAADAGRIVQNLQGPMERLGVTISSPELEKAERTPPATVTATRTALVWRVAFRGRRLEDPQPVSLYPVPEATRMEHARPRAAAVAVRAGPGLLAKHGVAKGALAVVLDVSGSTGPVAGEAMTERTRNRQLVRALRAVLAKVPRGTTVSVWTFGQAVGGGRAAIAEDTVQRVQDPVGWTGERRQLDEVMSRVEGLTPWNESPIVRTMLRAKEDLTRAEGARNLVVLTDGMDNRIAKDAAYNPEKKSVPELLTDKFKGSGIAVHIVGFQVVDKEEAEARKQFAGVAKFTPPGSFTTVREVDGLVRALDRVMRPELRYRIVGDGVRTPETGVSANGESDRWTVLRPEGERGTYRVQVTTGWPLSQRIALNGGDALLLEIAGDSVRPACRRLVWSEQEGLRLRPSRERRGWRAAVLQDQRVASNAVQMLASLERLGGDEDTIEQPRPRALWLEASPSEAGSPAVRWGSVAGYPAPCWGIDATGWPAGARPVVRMWWSPDVEAPSRNLKQGENFRTLADVPHKTVLGGRPLSIDSAAVEEHWVWTTPTTREQRWCLVVRATTAQPVAVEPEGLPLAGQEHRHHTGAGRYAGLFWMEGVTTRDAAEAMVERKLAGLRFVALGQLKRESEQRRYYAEFADLDSPAALPGRPHAVFDPR